jgi:hypothetical protein
MAIIGQGVQAGLGRVDYTPYLQGAMAGAQGIAQGIAGLGKSTADAIQEYQKNKAANEILEAENTRYLAYMEKNPNMKGYAPDPSVIDKFRDKMLKGGLTLTDNRKLNAELNVAIKLHDRDREQERQKAYMDQVVQSTNKMKFDLEQAQRERSALDQFNTTLAQFGKDELTPEKIFETGVQLGTPASIVNAAVGGRLELGRYALSVEAKKANDIKSGIENQILQRQLDAAKNANPQGTVEIVEKDGIRVIKMTDPMGKVTFDPVREQRAKPTTTEQLSSAVQQYRLGIASKNPVLMNAAIADYADAMGFKGPGWSTDTIGEELAKLASTIPAVAAPSGGGAGIKSATPVRVEQKAPGADAAPASPSRPEVPVRTTGGQASAQPNLPPQPVTPYTPAANVRQQEDAAALQAFFAAQKALPQQGVGQAVNDYTAALVQNAPPAPVVDTNLFVGPHTAGKLEPSMRYGGYDYPAMSVLGGAERLASFLGPVEQQIQAPGRALNELGRYGSAALTGLFTGDYTVPEQGLVDIASQNIAKYLSGSNLPGETVRTLGQYAGTVPESGNAPLPNEVRNLPSATLDAMASGMESVSEARERMRKEDAAAKRAKTTTQAQLPRPMKSAELPQISLSKDSKRIADLLLQEYENNKGGKAPTFTITAARPGGKETSIKLSNPAILAIMSNPTNFGGMIRGNVEQFSQQNTRMNQILAEMEAARAARTRTVRGR